MKINNKCLRCTYSVETMNILKHELAERFAESKSKAQVK